MTKEILEQGQDLLSQISEKRSQLNRVKNVLDIASPANVPIKIHGTMIELPKAALKGKLEQRQTSLEEEITNLETQFANL